MGLSFRGLTQYCTQIYYCYSTGHEVIWNINSLHRIHLVKLSLYIVVLCVVALMIMSFIVKNKSKEEIDVLKNDLSTTNTSIQNQELSEIKKIILYCIVVNVAAALVRIIGSKGMVISNPILEGGTGIIQIVAWVIAIQQIINYFSVKHYGKVLINKINQIIILGLLGLIVIAYIFYNYSYKEEVEAIKENTEANSLNEDNSIVFYEKLSGKAILLEREVADKVYEISSHYLKFQAFDGQLPIVKHNDIVEMINENAIESRKCKNINIITNEDEMISSLYCYGIYRYLNIYTNKLNKNATFVKDLNIYSLLEKSYEEKIIGKVNSGNVNSFNKEFIITTFDFEKSSKNINENIEKYLNYSTKIAFTNEDINFSISSFINKKIASSDMQSSVREIKTLSSRCTSFYIDKSSDEISYDSIENVQNCLINDIVGWIIINDGKYAFDDDSVKYTNAEVGTRIDKYYEISKISLDYQKLLTKYVSVSRSLLNN